MALHRVDPPAPVEPLSSTAAPGEGRASAGAEAPLDPVREEPAGERTGGAGSARGAAAAEEAPGGDPRVAALGVQVPIRTRPGRRVALHRPSQPSRAAALAAEAASASPRARERPG